MYIKMVWIIILILIIAIMAGVMFYLRGKDIKVEVGASKGTEDNPYVFDFVTTDSGVTEIPAGADVLLATSRLSNPDFMIDVPATETIPAQIVYVLGTKDGRIGNLDLTTGLNILAKKYSNSTNTMFVVGKLNVHFQNNLKFSKVETDTQYPRLFVWK